MMEKHLRTIIEAQLNDCSLRYHLATLLSRHIGRLPWQYTSSIFVCDTALNHNVRLKQQVETCNFASAYALLLLSRFNINTSCPAAGRYRRSFRFSYKSSSRYRLSLMPLLTRLAAFLALWQFYFAGVVLAQDDNSNNVTLCGVSDFYNSTSLPYSCTYQQRW